jgi:hypothetical protein
MPTPPIEEFLDTLDELLSEKEWPTLDRDGITRNPGHDAVRVVLPHRDRPEANVAVEVHDHEVIVTYFPEHLRFTLPSEALRFVEMLGDGRVTLVVKRRLFWNAIWSYRDALPLPFNKTLEPWLNVRPRVETLSFGFGA